ncbi:MAG: flagellin FliC5 [Lachnospiraceae bacterium]|nr:flagellin FliC5 [Lachnospiraceae bacterium]
MSDMSIGGSSSRIYGQIASGSALPTAAAGPAEMAIAEREETQATGLNVGADNMKSGVELSNVADGGLANITDSLQRMRELAIQASNDTLTDSDRSHIQDEIDQLKQGISDIANQTTYNTKNLLDGSNSNIKIATDSNPNSVTVNTGDATLEALGIKDFDVTKRDFNIDDIDKAIQSVNDTRSNIGAKTNALEHGINYNYNAAENTTSAQSRLEDLDIPKAVTDLKKKETLDTYQVMMQKMKQDNERAQSNQLFGNIG